MLSWFCGHPRKRSRSGGIRGCCSGVFKLGKLSVVLVPIATVLNNTKETKPTRMRIVKVIFWNELCSLLRFPKVFYGEV